MKAKILLTTWTALWMNGRCIDYASPNSERAEELQEIARRINEMDETNPDSLVALAGEMAEALDVARKKPQLLNNNVLDAILVRARAKGLLPTKRTPE